MQSLAEFVVDARSVDDKGNKDVKIVFTAPNGTLVRQYTKLVFLLGAEDINVQIE